MLNLVGGMGHGLSGPRRCKWWEWHHSHGSASDACVHTFLKKTLESQNIVHCVFTILRNIPWAPKQSGLHQIVIKTAFQGDWPWLHRLMVCCWVSQLKDQATCYLRLKDQAACYLRLLATEYRVCIRSWDIFLSSEHYQACMLRPHLSLGGAYFSIYIVYQRQCMHICI